jgi:phthalate 4,5-dioxygenase oxygenase subunit
VSLKENEMFVRVGAETPMGRLLRRYWLPVTTSEELEAAGAPQQVRLLGEDLVAYRSPDGTVGLVGEHCPHRGASLALARNIDCGLECIYHGWQIDRGGVILSTPAEPEKSRFKDQFRHTSYSILEAGGLVWCYMGPVDKQPDPPQWPFLDVPASHSLFARAAVKCDWTQSVEGAIDSAHQTYLHDARSRIARDTAHVERIEREGGDLVDGLDESGQIVRPWNDGRPSLKVETTDYGFRYAAIRKPMIREDELKNVRVSHFFAPGYVVIPGPEGWAQLLMHVPIDDDSTMFWHVRSNLHEPYSDEDRSVHLTAAGLVPGVDIDSSYRRVASRENRWLQDRDEMRFGDRLSGIHGTVNEDHAVQESMGPRYDRTKEHLGTSDMAVIRFRRMMIAAAVEHDKTGVAIGIGFEAKQASARGEDQTIPIEAPWESVGVR